MTCLLLFPFISRRKHKTRTDINMADSTSPKDNSGDFTKKLQRRLSRGKEKVLQRLGKSIETRDNQFEFSHQLFVDQQTDGSRIHKDLRNYINAVRDMREASRRLSQSLFDVYESEWAGEEELGAFVEAEDLLWNDYEVKLLDQAVRTMESYMSQFPDVKDKVAKRGRKLVDYDSTLHHLEALQAAKKRDDIKINKAEEEMKSARSVYENINNELKQELPVLYKSRIGCYVAVFSSLSNLRDIFFKEMHKINQDLNCVIKELQAQHPDNVFAVRGLQPYGSLRRKTLMSPRAWKSSFSDFNRSYSTRTSQRFSFRSPDKPLRGTLSRESSSLTVSQQSAPLDKPGSEPRDLDVESNHSEAPGSSAAAAGATEGNELKSGDNNKEVEVEEEESEPKPPTESDNRRDDEKAQGSESSSEVNNSYESESLEAKLSAVDNGLLHIEEDDDSLVTHGARKSNGEVSGLNSDTKALDIPHKDVSAEVEVSLDSKSTVV